MLSVASTAYAAPVIAARQRSATGDFGALLAPRDSARGPDASTAATGSAALLMLQAGSAQPWPQRRRRTPRESAQRAVDLLRALQRGLLGDGEISEAALEAAAEEAEEMMHAAGDPEARRLCAAVALRLRVELARLQGPGVAA